MAAAKCSVTIIGSVGAGKLWELSRHGRGTMGDWVFELLLVQLADWMLPTGTPLTLVDLILHAKSFSSITVYESMNKM